jgi:hypothetical protein
LLMLEVAADGYSVEKTVPEASVSDFLSIE